MSLFLGLLLFYANSICKYDHILVVCTVPSDLSFLPRQVCTWAPSLLVCFAQSARAVEYTDCFSTEEQDPLPNECPGYNTKQFEGEAPVMLELWGMWSTPSLPSLPDALRLGVVAPDRALSMG